MKYCPECGEKIIQKTPENDDRLRHVCNTCDQIHYQNPKIVTGCIPEWEDKVLLCKRAIEPRLGYWTLPAGYMELGETSLEGAMRETWEEATARVEVQGLYAVFNLPHVDQVYMMFRSKLLDLDYKPGAESLEVKLFSEQEIPWDELAFTTVRETLRFYFSDLRRQEFQIHTGDIIREDGRYRLSPGPSWEVN